MCVETGFAIRVNYLKESGQLIVIIYLGSAKL